MNDHSAKLRLNLLTIAEHASTSLYFTGFRPTSQWSLIAASICRKSWLYPLFFRFALLVLDPIKMNYQEEFSSLYLTWF
jgi:hypothetical protein